MLKPAPTNNLIELQLWCRQFEQEYKLPCDVVRRYAIGFYQLYQGIGWSATASGPESWVSAAIHFLCASERMELNLEEWIPNDLRGIAVDVIPGGYKDLLFVLSRMQSQVIYFSDDKRAKRKIRFNLPQSKHDLSKIILICFSQVNMNVRNSSMRLAMEIMTRTV